MVAPDAMMRSKSESRSGTSSALSSNGMSGAGPPVRQSSDLSYMHRPPTIMPNYGKSYRGGVKLKTNIPRVLLYDNVTQQTMLDVQLSGIQSQQYKNDRELEMHMKSFLLRKQQKDKALQKLTKVQHGEDYSEFEQEYYGYLGADGEGRSLGCLSLPSIRSTNGISSSVHSRGRRRGRKRKQPQRTVSLNGHGPSYLDSEEQCSVALPNINQMNSTLGKTNNHGQSNGTHHFVPQRRVGFRFEKSPAGVTRIFHALPSSNGDATHNGDGHCDQVVDTDAEIGAIRAANRPGTVEDSADASLQPDGLQHSEDSEISSEYHKNRRHEAPRRREATFDYRFQMLQQSLVRQDPPNEGFLELSPSFVRHNPLENLGEKLALLGVKKKTSMEEDVRHRQIALSYTLSPDLSDGQTYDSESEVSTSRADNSPDRTLNKLAAY